MNYHCMNDVFLNGQCLFTTSWDYKIIILVFNVVQHHYESIATILNSVTIITLLSSLFCHGPSLWSWFARQNLEDFYLPASFLILGFLNVAKINDPLLYFLSLTYKKYDDVPKQFFSLIFLCMSPEHHEEHSVIRQKSWRAPRGAK